MDLDSNRSLLSIMQLSTQPLASSQQTHEITRCAQTNATPKIMQHEVPLILPQTTLIRHATVLDNDHPDDTQPQSYPRE